MKRHGVATIYQEIDLVDNLTVAENIFLGAELKNRMGMIRAKERKIEISALAFYPNTMDGDLEKRKENICHLKKVIRASALLGVYMTTTFIGRDQHKTIEENLALFDEV